MSDYSDTLAEAKLEHVLSKGGVELDAADCRILAQNIMAALAETELRLHKRQVVLVLPLEDAKAAPGPVDPDLSAKAAEGAGQ